MQVENKAAPSTVSPRDSFLMAASPRVVSCPRRPLPLSPVGCRSARLTTAEPLGFVEVIYPVRSSSCGRLWPLSLGAFAPPPRDKQRRDLGRATNGARPGRTLPSLLGRARHTADSPRRHTADSPRRPATHGRRSGGNEGNEPQTVRRLLRRVGAGAGPEDVVPLGGCRKLITRWPVSAAGSRGEG